MEWILVKVGEGISYACQLLAGQNQVFIVGVMVGGIIVYLRLGCFPNLALYIFDISASSLVRAHR